MMNKQSEPGMSLIVQTVARLSTGFILLYGIYILSHGHISPGGGFAGGVLIALSFINIMLAYGKETTLRKLPKVVTSFFENLGALLLLSIALLGFTGGYFFLNFIAKGEPYKLFSAGIIPLCNLAISIKVGTGIFAIFSALVLLRYEKKHDDKEE
jgi:multicomponent Na+:H+ antiporter subunit B